MLALDFVVGQREKSECHKTGDCNAVVMQWQCAKCIFDTNDFFPGCKFSTELDASFVEYNDSWAVDSPLTSSPGESISIVFVLLRCLVLCFQVLPSAKKCSLVLRYQVPLNFDSS